MHCDTNIFILFVCLLIRLLVCLFLCLFVCFIYLFIYLFVYLFVCLFVCFFISLFHHVYIEPGIVDSKYVKNKYVLYECASFLAKIAGLDGANGAITNSSARLRKHCLRNRFLL